MEDVLATMAVTLAFQLSFLTALGGLGLGVWLVVTRRWLAGLAGLGGAALVVLAYRRQNSRNALADLPGGTGGWDVFFIPLHVAALLLVSSAVVVWISSLRAPKHDVAA